MSSASTSSEQPEVDAPSPKPFIDWTKDEKFDLYLGLKHYGYNIEEIQKRVRTKSEEEIHLAIEYFKDELSRRYTNTVAGKPGCRKYKPEAQIPLAKWADLMTETHDFQELQTECATAVRIIAEFEKFHPPTTTSNIDFRKIYHYLADAMEGKPLPNDPLSADVLNHCVMESAAMSRVFIPEKDLQDILAMFHVTQGAGSSRWPRPTKDGGLAALRHIASQHNYNPLNIPEQYLKHRSSYTSDGGSTFS